MADPELCKVLTVRDWYDGPRSGAAEYDGQPYWYRSTFLVRGSDPNDGQFELTPLPGDALALELERDEIFWRWSQARRNGEIEWVTGDLASFGAIPEDRSRNAYLNRTLKSLLENTAATLLVQGKFEVDCRLVRWKLLRHFSSGP